MVMTNSHADEVVIKPSRIKKREERSSKENRSACAADGGGLNDVKARREKLRAYHRRHHDLSPPKPVASPQLKRPTAVRAQAKFSPAGIWASDNSHLKPHEKPSAIACAWAAAQREATEASEAIGPGGSIGPSLGLAQAWQGPGPGLAGPGPGLPRPGQAGLL